MYMRYVKSDDDITTVCGLLVVEFLCFGLIPSVALSSIAMNMVNVYYYPTSLSLTLSLYVQSEQQGIRFA